MVAILLAPKSKATPVPGIKGLEGSYFAISVVVGAGAAWFGLYTNSSKSKGDFSKGGQ